MTIWPPIFFSPLDLSCALESPNSVQCPGYSTEDAAKIVANLLLFSSSSDHFYLPNTLSPAIILA